MTQNGQQPDLIYGREPDPVYGRESDLVSTELMSSMSDSLCVLTLNGVELRDTNHLVTNDDVGADTADILSQIDNALASYTDGSSQPV